MNLAVSESDVPRPRLEARMETVNELAMRLAKEDGERAEFLRDPSHYLRSQNIPVDDCRLAASSVPDTSEVCTWVVVCVTLYHLANEAINVNAAMNANGAANYNWCWNENYVESWSCS